ncbi:helicase-like protein [Maribacter vaceletii]|uniref:Helicase-like protein n=1 Tax=Maribacter vaceletii TaxID=1206816 RepID=A0A495ECS5_9FLAO|nr:DEAD/DEAH box helicase family protein [Maribacter vaceletii]RKR14672.1 helicase-like protein [Maribacter vaceletii]
MIPSLQSLSFKYPWRTYQGAFLAHFNEHIKDNHLHVIAPPGSGKTLLGLEIVRQLGKKTLILAPTLTIRNQWENRLQEFFTLENSFKAFSFAISKPSDVTFSTYQGLHSFFKKQQSQEAFLNFFKEQGIQTLVLDEAHHLKNEWWKCLNTIKQELNLTVVALTATPPYDSGSAEVQRYFDLCGPIDDEIAVPDLVKEGDLCAHQDFVHLSLPDDSTINYIYEFRQKVAQLLEELQLDVAFRELIKNHRFLNQTETYLEDIYQNPTYFSALLIYLQSINFPVATDKLEVLGFNEKELVDFPALTTHWLRILLNYLFFQDRENLEAYEVELKKWEKKLRKLGVLKTKRIDLIGSELFYQTLSTSASKLNSIVAITEASEKDLRVELRAVVLTDYIRKEYLNPKKEDVSKINKIGVLPIFHRLKVSNVNKKTIGILTGSLVIISTTAKDKLEERHLHIKFNFQELESDSDFVILQSANSGETTVVEIITDLFQDGIINILIGTKSLLGEGWDAPAINTLILASFVGSFVSSNQMRGRAIRSQQGNPNKTAVIWHLACIDPTDENNGKDFETLTRRFDAFMGISKENPVYIESGLDRLSISKIYTGEEVSKANKETLFAASNREKIKSKWQQAVLKGTGLQRELKKYHTSKKPFVEQKKLLYKDMVTYGFIEIVAMLTFFLPEFLLKNMTVLLTRGWLQFIYALLSAFVFGFGIKTYKAIKLYVTYGKIHKHVAKMGWAVVHTMQELGYTSTAKSKLQVETNLDAYGTVSCVLLGASNYESSIFITALEEIIAPIENPRYLLLNKHWFKKRFGIENFFVVPTIFGDKKERALLFLKHWEENIGNAQLIYTRQKKGRGILLRARILHITNAQEKVTKKAVIWN